MAGISRQSVAAYWIPTEDEWYKAAYYQPAAAGGDTDGYWLYPTRSNDDPGNTIGPIANQANFKHFTYSVTQSGSYSSTQNYLTNGEAYSGSASYYRTFDQCGNVIEWTETVKSASLRGLRGGSWGTLTGYPFSLRSDWDVGEDPSVESREIGFRVARP